MILAADVGGTKTRLALVTPGSAPRAPRREQRLGSRDYPSLEALVTAFLAGDPPPTRAVFGVAGPVIDQRCVGANLPWTVDAASLSAAMGGTRVTLLNDLETTAHGVDVLKPHDFETLQAGTPRPGPRALIAAGTGLGIAIVGRLRGHWHPMATEGGHGDFAARDADEAELRAWLAERYRDASHGHVSVERVLSGPGLADLYRFLGTRGRGDEPAAFAARAREAADLAPLVTEAALARSCERAVLAVEWFVRVYGAEAGNLALRVLPSAGLYVGGGIAPRLLPFLRGPAFLEAFHDKGRLRSLVEQVPVHVVLDDATALWGAARVALEDPAEPA